MDVQTVEGFAIVELLGHIRYSARMGEITLAGVAMLRCDVLDPDSSAPLRTEIVAPGSLYRVTIVDEATARRAARFNAGTGPLQEWQLAEPSPPAAVRQLAPVAGARDDDAYADDDEYRDWVGRSCEP